MDGRIIKTTGWQRRKARVRKKVKGTTERPRLNVFRSNKHIYAQLIDDVTGVTIAAASSKVKGFDDKLDQSGAAKQVGATIGTLAITKGVEKVVFDRSGYQYHGRIKALADAAREAGLQF